VITGEPLWFYPDTLPQQRNWTDPNVETASCISENGKVLAVKPLRNRGQLISVSGNSWERIIPFGEVITFAPRNQSIKCHGLMKKSGCCMRRL
jgi:hypothetical protein